PDRSAGAASAKYRSLMATECVHLVPKRDSSAETSCGVRLLASAIGMLDVDSTLMSEQVASSFSIRSDLPLANGMEASVKTTTPARPLDWLTTQSALTFATSSTLVVMLLKSFGAVLGPGVPTACQP